MPADGSPQQSPPAEWTIEEGLEDKPVEKIGPTRRLLPDEFMRIALALLLLALFALTLWFAFKAPANEWTRTKEFLQIALPVETGFLGSAVGYYFGSHRRRD